MPSLAQEHPQKNTQGSILQFVCLNLINLVFFNIVEKSIIFDVNLRSENKTVRT
jgi:hypothetical protein